DFAFARRMRGEKAMNKTFRSAAALALCACLAAGGCSGGKNEAKRGGAPEQVFTFSNGTEPETLDPGKMTGIPEANIALALFEGLVALDHRTLAPVPGVAERWEVSDDGKVWTFFLRKNARWSNGDPVTAHDFHYSWKRVLEPETASRYAYQAYYIRNGAAYNRGDLKDFRQVGVKVVDTYTLRVELENPTPFFTDIAAFHTLFPVHKKTVEKYGDRWTRPENMVSNGPFLLKDWKPRDRVVVVKNHTYWDAGAVKLEKVVILATEDENTAFNMYEAGETEWIRTVPLPQIPRLKDKRKDFHITPFLGIYYYLFNTTRKPLDDTRVRKALDMAVDKAKICEYVLKAGQQPAAAFVPPGIPGYTSPPGPPYDVKRARQLLAEAGFPDGKGFPRLTILFNTHEAHKSVAEVIQQMWNQNLNVRVELENKEWKIYLKERETLNYDIARAGWIGDYVDPNTFLDMFVTGGGNNNTGWGLKRFDDLIAAAAGTFDPGERAKIFREAENILINEQMPVMPIYYYVNMNMIKPWVKGFHFNVRDYHTLKGVYIAPH
ncbi:MAG: peptide ABC transporter substrate-binding protein, partial [bacterium]